jgi:hypothetical protein
MPRPGAGSKASLRREPYLADVRRHTEMATRVASLYDNCGVTFVIGGRFPKKYGGGGIYDYAKSECA